ncbi:MAG: prepilin-type N-terminal cleavage/methylation domain-containing protein [Planctomycetota bacterium]|nr:prepilin-type N-terminal cleavage/methylation domain-containing protein [Planctomycetota bacterium]
MRHGTQVHSSRKLLRAFTLVELLVAMALGVILTGAIVFIFVQSQKIFTEMDAKVSVYNYARTAFDTVERDLANTAKTADMEFFQDSESDGIPGHYDRRNGDPEAIPVSSPFGDPHFLIDKQEKYIYGMTLHQPPPYTGFDGKKHRHDSIYFRTVTSVNGQTKPVLVEYALDYRRASNGTLRLLPILVRRHWSITKIQKSLAGPQITLNGDNKAIESELCLYVTDVKFEFYLQDKRSGRPGRLYSAEEACRGPVGSATNQANIRMRNFATDGGFKIACFYDSRHLHTKQEDKAVYDQKRKMLITENIFHFPMTEVGDRMVLFNFDIPSATYRDLTIKSIERFDTGSGAGGTAGTPKYGIRFIETLPTYTKDPECEYRTGFLPSMVRMTVKIKDRKRKAVRTLVRQFKLLGA